ncbi:hypothetical protein BGZ80_003632 [Entomortierella chlamydospora]|uniref:Mtf2-like C-terminal domain-containing protein n=1 Tax=Entomortierella chlamydospora TaxID=101097 RepID=A0A9P6MP00_9FUNG|nr:hypothetical protein BGZ80_003632 [Entomortierella chlamydospora]
MPLILPESASAVNRALALPEIVFEILACLEAQAELCPQLVQTSLRACTLVNRTWFFDANIFLYRAPYIRNGRGSEAKVNALVRTLSSTNRGLYVRSLSRCKVELWEMFPSLENLFDYCPRLSSLALCFRSGEKGHLMEPFESEAFRSLNPIIAQGMAHVQELDMTSVSINSVDKDDTAYVDAALNCLSACARLQKFVTTRADWTNIRTISRHLTDLSISFVAPPDLKTSVALGPSLVNLTSLHLHHAPHALPSHDFSRVLAQYCRSLTKIDVCPEVITSRSLEMMTLHNPGLVSIHLRNCPDAYTAAVLEHPPQNLEFFDMGIVDSQLILRALSLCPKLISTGKSAPRNNNTAEFWQSFLDKARQIQELHVERWSDFYSKDLFFNTVLPKLGPQLVRIWFGWRDLLGCDELERVLTSCDRLQVLRAPVKGNGQNLVRCFKVVAERSRLREVRLFGDNVKFCDDDKRRSRQRQYFGKSQVTRLISTYTPNFQDTLTSRGGTTSNESKDTTPDSSTQLDAAITETATIATEGSTSKEDLVKKFKLKPSVEVGIRARMLEKQRKQAEEKERIAAENESRTGAEKINRLFEKLQLGGKFASAEGSDVTGHEAVPAASKSISNSWKFLFDETELNENNGNEGGVEAEGKETLDRIPGASNLFPSLSEYQTPPSTPEPSSPTPITEMDSELRLPSTDRWKDPKMKGTERGAFKALFSSLFEQKKPEQQETSPGEKMQSLFSNFNRTGLEQTMESAQESESKSSPFDILTGNFSSTAETGAAREDPMQVRRRQLENLSKRAEPIYLEKKPKTSPFKVMENTVGPQDWLSQDPTMPQENTLFNAIRDENKVSIRMRKELEEKLGNVVQVKQFVDDLIAPFVEPQSVFSSNAVKPSSSSLDSLLAHAILAISSTRLEAGDSKTRTEETQATTDPQPLRSLHPYLGHALVEHTRRQGLPVFIRAVRTESYKALLKSRWDAWHDGPGCLEILKEMQRSGALVDSETKAIVKNMDRDLKAHSSTPSSSDLASATSKEQLCQYGWGSEEQAASLVEMLNIISVANEDGDSEYNMKQWAKRAKSNK